MSRWISGWKFFPAAICMFLLLPSTLHARTGRGGSYPAQAWSGEIHGRVWDILNHPVVGAHVLVTDTGVERLYGECISVCDPGPRDGSFAIDGLPTDEDLMIFAFHENAPGMMAVEIVRLEDHESRRLMLDLEGDVTEAGYMTLPGGAGGLLLRIVSVLNRSENLRSAQALIEQLEGLSSGGSSSGSERIVFSADEDGRGSSDVYLMDPDGSNLVNLSQSFSGDAVHPELSPDGRRIAFNEKASRGTNSVWVMNSDGTSRERVFSINGWGGVYDWIDDEHLLVRRGNSLLSVNILSGASSTIASSPFLGQANPRNARVSPDGTMIASIWQEESWAPTRDVYVCDIDGGNARMLYGDPSDNNADPSVFWGADDMVIWLHWCESGVGKSESSAILAKYVHSSVGQNGYDEVLVSEDGQAKGILAVSPDESSLLLGYRGRVVVRDIGSGSERTILRPNDGIRGADWGIIR